jgi:hypothetical protein
MTLAYDRAEDGAACGRVVAIVRAGVLAQDLCRRGGRAEVAAVFDRSFYLRTGDDFVCIGEPSIGNGPLTLIAGARMAQLGLQQGQRGLISNRHIAIGDLRLDLSNCTTWRPPPWPAPSPALPALCLELARHASVEGPADCLARADFGSEDTPLARVARPRLAKFVGWAKRRRRVPTIDDRGGHGASRLSPPYDLVGLGPGLTPSGDDFLMGALAVLDALGRAKMHAALGHAVAAGAPTLTSPLSACFLRAAAAGHVGECLHAMVAAALSGDIEAALAAARRIGHTSGWDALAGVATTLRATMG